MKKRNLSILGSTGSIGVQCLNIVRRYPEHFRVVALSAHTNTALLAEQVREFSPELVAVTDEHAYRLSSCMFGKTRVLGGLSALNELSSYQNADTVVAAIVGADGFLPVMAAVKAGKRVALANKESLVCGGKLIMELASKTGAEILPVDSEHSAVFQVLQGGKEFRRILLTASGGAFFGKSRAELDGVTVEQATRHPNWSMGKKITVDSSTLMNKGLEIIEARWLFDTLDIDYVIHPESIIHSMVEFLDGSILAQMSYPSMEYPIQLALSYPERLVSERGYYDFSQSLTFHQPDEDTFILPKLAKEALKAGDGAPLVLNAVNEAAVHLFLNKHIGFTHIFDIVQSVMQTAVFPSIDSPESVVAAHNEWYKRILTGSY